MKCDCGCETKNEETRTRLEFQKDGSLRPIGTYRLMAIPACEYSGMSAIFIDKPYYAKRRKFLSTINKWITQVYTLCFDELCWVNYPLDTGTMFPGQEK